MMMQLLLCIMVGTCIAMLGSLLHIPFAVQAVIAFLAGMAIAAMEDKDGPKS